MDDSENTTAAMSAAPSARELVACWADRVARFDLSEQGLVLGRGEGSDVPIPHASVSRSHARLEIGPQGIAIEDLGSANGVRVDGVAVEGRCPVPLGALVELGTVRLIVRLKADAAPSPMLAARRLLTKVAPSTVSVILVGETGVGKEVLTEEIHARSGRTGPLVRVNCAGLDSALLESELFGYERGAFTGAVSAKEGLIESAEGGTLFLDELAEMPAVTQSKLLRVLESREVRRIGALKAKSIDVRFVSATHKDPRSLAAIGRFREDLLFRLNGLTISVPPLRQRREEIGHLVETFLREACERAGSAVPVLSEGARTLLESYRWPGNVRELRNVVHRTALLCDGPVVLVEHLHFDSAHSASPPEVPRPLGGPPAEALESARGPEGQRIAEALARVGGNQAAAAKALGITPRMLAYRMDKLGLPRPRRG
jgi:two-component system, NtrC family, response regulator AtoC